VVVIIARESWRVERDLGMMFLYPWDEQVNTHSDTTLRTKLLRDVMRPIWDWRVEGWEG
jgi:hypothetical protein